MFKPTLIALCLGIALAPLSSAKTEKTTKNVQAVKTWTEKEVEALKKQWLQAQLQEQQKRLAQRENFLQLESLMQAAIKKGEFSPALMQISQDLIQSLQDYPLLEEAEWAIVRAKRQAKQLSDNELADFIQRYPYTAKRNNLAQDPFETLFEQQKLAELITYAEKVKPIGMENQCRVLAAKYQLFAEKSQANPEAEQANNEGNEAKQALAATELATLLNEFEHLWLGTDSYWKTNATLPSTCGALDSVWLEQKRKTSKLIETKALNLYKQGAGKALAHLVETNQNTDLSAWLSGVEKLLNQPESWLEFAEQQAFSNLNRPFILAGFNAYIRTQPEQLEKPDFNHFKDLMDKWQLEASEQEAWKISFLNRFFDNEDKLFQQWRDQEIMLLKRDNLTERRLRLAIRQQADLKPWINALSEEGKAKAEWRYWVAKSDPTKKSDLESLSQERGFYSMLAAYTLGKTYQVNMPDTSKISDNVTKEKAAFFDRIAELRELKRFSQAKHLWVEQLKELSFEDKLAFSQLASERDWFDLAVEGTIQAKAWDYIPLRLPNAYSDWFDLNLKGKNVNKSFAMAIARQESAWNFQAKSHANAIGLMQMLPATASETAKNSALPFGGEVDLLDPFKNIMLGTSHLAELNTKYPNNRILIAAAYNAGSHRADAWLKRSAGKLTMDEFIASIPFYETRGYVQNVLAYDYYYQLLQGAEKPVMFTAEEQGKYGLSE